MSKETDRSIAVLFMEHCRREPMLSWVIEVETIDSVVDSMRYENLTGVNGLIRYYKSLGSSELHNG